MGAPGTPWRSRRAVPSRALSAVRSADVVRSDDVDAPTPGAHMSTYACCKVDGVIVWETLRDWVGGTIDDFTRRRHMDARQQKQRLADAKRLEDEHRAFPWR